VLNISDAPMSPAAPADKRYLDESVDLREVYSVGDAVRYWSGTHKCFMKAIVQAVKVYSLFQD